MLSYTERRNLIKSHNSVMFSKIFGNTGADQLYIYVDKK